MKKLYKANQFLHSRMNKLCIGYNYFAVISLTLRPRGTYLMAAGNNVILLDRIFIS